MAKISLVITDNDGSHHTIVAHDIDNIIQAQSGSSGQAPALAGFWGIDPGTLIKTARCAAACKPKAGYAACVARCIATDQVCDGGVSNCSPL